MFKRFSGIVKKEFIELLRDKLALILIFIAPVLVIFLEGYGLVFDVKKIPLAFLDYDRSKLSREYINSFVNSEYFKFYRLVSNYKEAEELIKKGEIRALIVIPPDFSRKLYKWQNVQVQILVDGTYPNRAQIVKGYV
ncbi:MAG: ABC transporter permease, partial [Thermodesulfobacterium sp.]|nr:ABC transporter permease [Thermodesulfobacterium sp.]